MAERVRKKRFRRVRTPTVLQMEATECGAASLAMILAYFGRRVPLEELRVECRVSRDGSNALYIKKAAEKYGVPGKGFQMTTEQLRGLRPPFIVFWELNHFLVVEGLARDRVYLNDPASGRRTVSLEEFTESYAGIVFRFEPAPTFQKGGLKPSTWRAISRRIGGAYAAVVFAVMTGVALMAAELVTATFSPLFVDQILVAQRWQWIRPLLLVMGLTLLFRVLVGSMQLAGLLRLKKLLAARHSARFVWHVLRLPTPFYQQRYAGDIAGRVDGNSAVADLVSGPLATTVVGLLMVVVYGAVMFAFDPLLAAVGVVLGALNMVGIAAAQRVLADENIKVSHFGGLLAGSMMHAVQIIETLKAGASEHEALVRLTGNQARVTNASQRVTVVAGFLVVLPPFLSLVTTAAVLGLGGGHVIDGIMSVGALVAFQTLLAQFNRPFSDLVGLGSSVQTLQAELTRLDDVEQHPVDPVFDPARAAPALTLAAAPAPTSPPRRDPPRRLSGRLEFRDVTFGFNRTIDEPLIKRLSLTIRPGSRVALVGSSGSGKSTIGRLAAGLLRPWEGEILYDGFPIDLIPRDVFTDQVGMVDDQTLLFSGTIRDNLTLWDDTVAEREVTRAAMDAGIHREIVRLRNGYAARLSEGGRNLSGGQRQRIELGRALVKNPALLILDEATSALDPVTEALVDDNLRRRGCTCLIIAHRLSTIRDCEEIIVLRQGKVIERGTHDELMADASGFYAQLQTLQDGTTSTASAPERAGRSTAVPVAVAVNAAVEPAVTEGASFANGHAHDSASLPPTNGAVATAPVPCVAMAVETNNGRFEPAPAQAMAMAVNGQTTAAVERSSTMVETIDAERPADLAEALALVGEVVTASGNQPVALDDPGAFWRVTSGQIDVFYLGPHSGHDGGRRHHLCRVEEGGSMFGLEGIDGGEQGELLAVGVGPARLLKVPKTDLLRLSLDSDWRPGVAALVDDWVDRISRAISSGELPSTVTLLKRDESHEAPEGRFLTARREVLWVKPGLTGIRFLDRVSVPTCPHESRFPLSPHAWITYNQSDTVQPWDTETLIEKGDPWEALKRFHQVVLDGIAAAQAIETAQAGRAARNAAGRRDVGLGLHGGGQAVLARTRWARPGCLAPGRAHDLDGGRRSHRGVRGGGCGAGDRGRVPAARRRDGPSAHRRARLGLSHAARQADGAVVGAGRRPDARLPGEGRPTRCPYPRLIPPVLPRRPRPQHPSPRRRRARPYVAALRRRLLPDTLVPAPDPGRVRPFRPAFDSGRALDPGTHGLDLWPARPGRPDRDRQHNRRRNSPGGPRAARLALRVPPRGGAGHRLVPGDPDRRAGSTSRQAGVEPAARVLGPAALSPRPILRPVRGRRPRNPGPRAGPVDPRVGRHHHGIDAGVHLRAVQRGRPVDPQLAARTGRGRAVDRLPPGDSLRPAAALELPEQNLKAPGRNRRPAVLAARRDRADPRRRRRTTSLCALGGALSRATPAEPPVANHLGPAGALRRRLAARRPDGSLASARSPGYAAFRSVGEFLAFNSSVDAGSRRRGKPEQGGRLFDRRPEWNPEAIRP